MSDIPAGKVPVMESVKEAYSYFFANWTQWIPAGIILGLVAGWYQMQVIALAKGESSIPITVGVFLIFLLTSLVFSAAVYRHCFRGEFSQPVGLDLGKDELRVLGAAGSVALVFGIIALFILILIGGAAFTLIASAGIDPSLAETNPEAFSEAALEAMGGGAAGLIIIFMIFLGCVSIFVSVRLCFVTAATVAEQRMMIFQTWGFTKGNFWRIVGAMILTALPVGILVGIVMAIVQAVIVGGVEDTAIATASAPQVFGFGFIEGIGNAIIALPSVALITFLYKGLRPSDEEMEILREKANKS